MKKRKLLDEQIGRFHILLETMENDPGLHDYGIPRSAWTRGIRFINHFGSAKALDVIDGRAERAADRGDYETARRWRTLITAIHALTEEERLPGQGTH
jgi:hypothetical protein